MVNPTERSLKVMTTRESGVTGGKWETNENGFSKVSNDFSSPVKLSVTRVGKDNDTTLNTPGEMKFTDRLEDYENEHRIIEGTDAEGNATFIVKSQLTNEVVETFSSEAEAEAFINAPVEDETEDTGDLPPNMTADEYAALCWSQVIRFIQTGKRKQYDRRYGWYESISRYGDEQEVKG